MGDRAQAEAFFKAGEAHVGTNVNQAFQNFVSASYIDPTWGQAHYQVGNNLSDLRHIHAATAAYRRALECKQDSENRAKTLANLGYSLQQIGELDEALETSLQATLLMPDLSLAWINLSIVHYLQNNTETAVSCALRAYEQQKTDASFEVALAFAYMHNRQFKEGLAHFEARFPYKLTQYLALPFTKWRGERDKIILIAADQGLGDTLSFARFVPQAAERCKHVFLHVQPQLVTLFQWAFIHLDNVTIQPLGNNFPGYDHWTTFVSLPFAMGLSEKEIVDAKHIDPKISASSRQWRVPDRKLHIGIAWAGSTLNLINAHRSIPIVHFLELYRVPGVQLYSLQVDERKQDLVDSGMAPVVRDLSGYIGGVHDTIGIMKNLDLVIACESSVPHMAALADVPCWVPYSQLGKDFRIGITGEKAIWTPKARYWLQKRAGDWRPVFDAMVTELRKQGENAPCL